LGVSVVEWIIVVVVSVVHGKRRSECHHLVAFKHLSPFYAKSRRLHYNPNVYDESKRENCTIASGTGVVNSMIMGNRGAGQYIQDEFAVRKRVNNLYQSSKRLSTPFIKRWYNFYITS
jgi:hypothetical protein